MKTIWRSTSAVNSGGQLWGSTWGQLGVVFRYRDWGNHGFPAQIWTSIGLASEAGSSERDALAGNSGGQLQRSPLRCPRASWRTELALAQS